MTSTPFANPFRPGAGHRPPYLAGRKGEEAEFRRLLNQTTIMENMVLTGLRGVGKTVLLEHLKPIALQEGWLWVGTDLSESASISETNLAQRLLTDLSVVTRNISVGKQQRTELGFTGRKATEDIAVGYEFLASIFKSTPGLVSDKLKAVFLVVAPLVKSMKKKGVIFAYDEAQNLSDHARERPIPFGCLA